MVKNDYDVQKNIYPGMVSCPKSQEHTPLKRTFALATLGCKVNQEESSSICTMMEDKGWQQVDFNEKAQVYIINTCTVTHIADKKSRSLIRRAISSNPKGLIVVTGCYAQVSKEELADLKGVSLIVGIDQRRHLPELVELKLDPKIAPYDDYYAEDKAAPTTVIVDDILYPHPFVELPIAGDKKRTRAYLKIEDGCDQFCNYCIVPYARGPIRSLEPEKVIEGVSFLIKEGYLEIVLTGIHIGSYGVDLPLLPSGKKPDLAYLVTSLLKLPGLGRLHLGSIEPHQFTEDLLRVLKKDTMSLNPQICPHLHIPLQAGCNKTLESMGRAYTTEEYAALLKKIRSFIPNVAITTDVIVGFPGELNEDFSATYNFCKESGFADIHVFQFSPRKLTVAAGMRSQVSAELKGERSSKLLALAEVLAQKYAKRFIGRPLQLLVETKVFAQDRNYWQGHGENYLTLLLPVDDKLLGEGKAKQALLNVSGKYWKNGRLIVEMAGK